LHDADAVRRLAYFYDMHRAGSRGAGRLAARQALLLRVLDYQRGEDATRSWAAGSQRNSLFDSEIAAPPNDGIASLSISIRRVTTQASPMQTGCCRPDASMRHCRSRIAVARWPDRARSVLASRDAGTLDAQRLQLAWQEADARGERAHLRDRARFELTLLRDPAKRSPVPVRVSRSGTKPTTRCCSPRTAAATHDRESLNAVREWQQRYHYQDVRLDTLLGASR
jgi:hypothetical protein